MARTNDRDGERLKPLSRKKAVKPRPRTRSVASPFLSVDEAALYLCVSPRALEHYRGEGGGPAYRKHGGSIVYHKLDLDRWSALRRYKSTAEKADT